MSFTGDGLGLLAASAHWLELGHNGFVGRRTFRSAYPSTIVPIPPGFVTDNARTFWSGFRDRGDCVVRPDAGTDGKVGSGTVASVRSAFAEEVRVHAQQRWRRARRIAATRKRNARTSTSHTVTLGREARAEQCVAGPAHAHFRRRGPSGSIQSGVERASTRTTPHRAPIGDYPLSGSGHCASTSAKIFSTASGPWRNHSFIAPHAAPAPMLAGIRSDASNRN